MKKKKRKTNKKEDNRVLFIVFILLLVLVIILGILCYKKNEDVNKKKDSTADIVIPILKTDSEEEFSINAANLAKVKRYIFKITNYQKDNINQEEIDYKIEITNNTNSIISVKRQDTKDLMTDQKNTIIDGLRLGKDEEENVYYYVEMKSHKKLKTNDLISIKIVS